jgi:hypothetical protein
MNDVDSKLGESDSAGGNAHCTEVGIVYTVIYLVGSARRQSETYEKFFAL